MRDLKHFPNCPVICNGGNTSEQLDICFTHFFPSLFQVESPQDHYKKNVYVTELY